MLLGFPVSTSHVGAAIDQAGAVAVAVAETVAGKNRGGVLG